MKRAASTALVLLIGAVLCGGQLGLLQAIGWASMLVSRTQSGSLASAVSTTFDGQHPCTICHFVKDQAGKDGGALGADLVKQIKKVELLLTETVYPLSTPTESLLVEQPSPNDRDGLALTPPTPPPRAYPV